MDGDHLDDVARAVPDYVVSREIGRGSFGVVWEARHRRLGRDVAIKELVGVASEEHIERFRREARVLARLDHPHVVRVFDYREQHGLRLLIMELLRGGSIDQRRRTGLDPPAVVTAGISAAWGLAHAHEQGILHRDVKPGNLLFDDRGVVKVTDFGIAGTIGPDRGLDNLTMNGAFLGTPAYAAPEQASAALGDEDDLLTEACDQYSLAATLYEALSGRLTHDPTGGTLALIRRRRGLPAQSILDQVPTLPAAVGRVLMKALERHPADRFPSMSAFASALEAACLPGLGAASPSARADATLVVDASRDGQGRVGRPVGSSRLIGRESDLLALSNAVDEHRLVTITAAGGVGKTSVALELARRHARAFVDGVFLAQLATTSDPADVARAVARALGIRDETAELPIDAIVDRLSDRLALLVLDNCEHVIDAAAAVADAVLTRCPGVTVVATSREPLRLGPEAVYRLAPLTVPVAGAPLADLVGATGTQLFVELARAQQRSFAVTTKNADVVATVVRRLDGIPLALELAAARLRSMSVTEIAERLDQRFQLLTTGERTVEPRQRTLRQTIGWSYALLSQAEQRALCRASVFVGGFDLDAGVAVLQTPSTSAYDVVDLIDALVDKSLLLRDEDATGRSRYAMLESIREYARDRLGSPDDDAEDEPQAAHLEHYLDVAEKAGRLLVGPAQVEVNGRLLADHDNLVAALTASTSLPDAVDKGLRLAIALYYYWSRNGVTQAMVPTVEALVDRSSDPDRRADGYALLTRAYCAVGQVHDAGQAAQRAVELAAQGTSAITTLRALRSRALARTFANQPEAALVDIDAWLEAAKRVDATDMEADALLTRASTLRSLGRAEEAGATYRSVIAAYAASGDLLGLASGLVNFADLALEWDDLDKAAASLREAEPLAKRLANPMLTSVLQGNLGLVALRGGDEKAAAGHFAEAISTSERINDRQSMINNLCGYARALVGTDPHLAARLLAATEALVGRQALIPDPNEQRLLTEAAALLKSRLTEAELDQARRAAENLTPREIASAVSGRQAT